MGVDEREREGCEEEREKEIGDGWEGKEKESEMKLNTVSPTAKMGWGVASGDWGL